MWSELLCQDDFLTKDSLDGLKTLKKNQCEVFAVGWEVYDRAHHGH